MKELEILKVEKEKCEERLRKYKSKKILDKVMDVVK